MTLSVTASKQNPVLCEDVTFTATTDPPGYASQVQWSAPGGQPGWSNDPSSTFTTHWPCIGPKTVTATLETLSASANVNVVLPDGSHEGSPAVSITVSTSLGCPPQECAENPTGLGCTGFDPNYGPEPTGSYTAVYNSCTWVWQVDIVYHRTYGTCPDNFTDICVIGDIDPNDRTEEHIASIIVDLLSGGSLSAYCAGCVWAHESVHKEAFDDSVEAQAQAFAISEVVDPVSINCSDPTTTDSTWVEAARETAILTAINDIYVNAVAAQASVEEDATQIGKDCNVSQGCEFCYYAASQSGWDLPGGCFSKCPW